MSLCLEIFKMKVVSLKWAGWHLGLPLVLGSVCVILGHVVALRPRPHTWSSITETAGKHCPSLVSVGRMWQVDTHLAICDVTVSARRQAGQSPAPCFPFPGEPAHVTQWTISSPGNQQEAWQVGAVSYPVEIPMRCQKRAPFTHIWL